MMVSPVSCLSVVSLSLLWIFHFLHVLRFLFVLPRVGRRMGDGTALPILHPTRGLVRVTPTLREIEDEGCAG